MLHEPVLFKVVFKIPILTRFELISRFLKTFSISTKFASISCECCTISLVISCTDLSVSLRLQFNASKQILRIWTKNRSEYSTDSSKNITQNHQFYRNAVVRIFSKFNSSIGTARRIVFILHYLYRILSCFIVLYFILFYCTVFYFIFLYCI